MSNEQSNSQPYRIDCNVGGRLRTFRTGVGMSTEDFAIQVGVSVYEVEQWESGAVRVPAEYLLVCGSVLHVHLGELFDTVGPKSPPSEQDAI